MKFGYFDDTNKEYVITSPKTPLPWINYLGSENFFSLISNTCGGYSFYKDAKLLRLTRYRYNNVPLDSNGHYYYIKDGDTIWNPGWISSALTPLPPVCRACRWCCTARRACRRRPWPPSTRTAGTSRGLPACLKICFAAPPLPPSARSTLIRICGWPSPPPSEPSLRSTRKPSIPAPIWLRAAKPCARWFVIRFAPYSVRPGRHKRSASDPPDAGQGVPAFASPRGRPFFLPCLRHREWLALS